MMQKQFTRTGWLILLLLFAQAAVAQNAVSDDDVNEVAKGLYCPVCESTPLDVCPTQACADWRDLIREQLEAGMSQQEIYAYFAAQYGDGVLAAPPRRGVNLILWLSPILALLGGGFIFVRTLRSLRNHPTAPPGNAPTTHPPDRPTIQPSGDYITQIEAELNELT